MLFGNHSYLIHLSPHHPSHAQAAKSNSITIEKFAFSSTYIVIYNSHIELYITGSYNMNYFSSLLSLSIIFEIHLHCSLYPLFIPFNCVYIYVYIYFNCVYIYIIPLCMYILCIFMDRLNRLACD